MLVVSSPWGAPGCAFHFQAAPQPNFQQSYAFTRQLINSGCDTTETLAPELDPSYENSQMGAFSPCAASPTRELKRSYRWFAGVDIDEVVLAPRKRGSVYPEAYSFLF